MQVEKQPSPWPSVVMLVGLVLFCLTLPRYWQTPTDRGHSAAGNHAALRTPEVSDSGTLAQYASNQIKTSVLRSHGGAYNRYSLGYTAETDLLSLWSGPTIEELVAARLASTQVNEGPVAWPVISFNESHVAVETQPAHVAVETQPAAELDSLWMQAFDQIGRASAAYAAAEVVPRLTVQAARVYQLWSTQSAEHLAQQSTAKADLRVIDPRLAVLPEPKEYAVPSDPTEQGFEPRPQSDPWCVPQILIDQLERIAQHPYTRDWAEAVLRQLRSLMNRGSLAGGEVQVILADLCALTEQASMVAEEVEDDLLRVELLRAHWALARRLDRWTVAHDIRVAAISKERFAARGSLGTYFDGPTAPSVVEVDELTANVEAYERSRNPELGRLIVVKKQDLEQSSDSLDHALAEAVEQHYRNANVRVAISAEMLNRFAGQERSEVRPLHDRINGATVRGQSHLQSRSRVELEPASGRWEMDLQSKGTIASNAYADGGQAQFRSRSATDFTANKRVYVDAEGVVMHPAAVDVDYRNRLMGVTTDVDWVPLVRTIARDRAMQEYHARQPSAKLQIESKVAAEAANTIDEKTQEAVERIENQVRERFTERLAEFGVKVTPVELTTTHERVIARLRVAGDNQPGSHTPRPRALSDSFASAQLHETALTNAAVALELDGRRYTAEELAKHIQQKFPQKQERTVENEQRAAVFEFADTDAVKFHIEDGRLEVTLSLKEVQLDGRRMRNFLVHAFYTPSIEGMEAELVRDGVLGVEGRLSSSDRARLHNVFNAVLPSDRAIPLVRLEDKHDERLAGLMITQLVLDDGWMSISVGPATSERVAEQSRSRRY